MTGIERRFSDDTRLIDLTVGELKTLIESLAPKTQVIEEKKYVYGYKRTRFSIKLFYLRRKESQTEW